MFSALSFPVCKPSYSLIKISVIIKGAGIIYIREYLFPVSIANMPVIIAIESVIAEIICMCFFIFSLLKYRFVIIRYIPAYNI